MRILSAFILVGLLLAACGAPSDAPAGEEVQDVGTIEVFRAPG